MHPLSLVALSSRSVRLPMICSWGRRIPLVASISHPLRTMATHALMYLTQGVPTAGRAPASRFPEARELDSCARARASGETEVHQFIAKLLDSACQF